LPSSHLIIGQLLRWVLPTLLLVLLLQWPISLLLLPLLPELLALSSVLHFGMRHTVGLFVT
jgi:hypothetical protein